MLPADFSGSTSSRFQVGQVEVHAAVVLDLGVERIDRIAPSTSNYAVRKNPSLYSLAHSVRMPPPISSRKLRAGPGVAGSSFPDHG